MVTVLPLKPAEMVDRLRAQTRGLPAEAAGASRGGNRLFIFKRGGLIV